MSEAPEQVHRPWGWYASIDRGEGFQVKRIHVEPGGRLSLQLHHRRAEHWVVVRGSAEVTVGDRMSLLQAGQHVHIPLGETHRLANPGPGALEIVEVQLGDYLGEDDIVRLDDLYGRA
jgi:mannose-1-phosphate guanylyltransferase / mannose-6-phosphate isomerase